MAKRQYDAAALTAPSTAEDLAERLRAEREAREAEPLPVRLPARVLSHIEEARTLAARVSHDERQGALAALMREHDYQTSGDRAWCKAWGQPLSRVPLFSENTARLKRPELDAETRAGLERQRQQLITYAAMRADLSIKVTDANRDVYWLSVAALFVTADLALARKERLFVSAYDLKNLPMLVPEIPSQPEPTHEPAPTEDTAARDATMRAMAASYAQDDPYHLLDDPQDGAWLRAEWKATQTVTERLLAVAARVKVPARPAAAPQAESPAPVQADPMAGFLDPLSLLKKQSDLAEINLNDFFTNGSN